MINEKRRASPQGKISVPGEAAYTTVRSLSEIDSNSSDGQTKDNPA